jgi:hypothetical protein
MGSIRSVLVVLASLLAGSVVQAGQAEDAQKSLFADLQFRRGFLLSYPDSSRCRAVEAVLSLGDSNNVPVWRLCQWAIKYSLAAVSCTQGTAGDRFYENEGKKVLVGGRDSPDRDDFYWFGVPFFDNRDDVPPAYMAQDAGKDDATGKFIYTVDGRALGVAPLKTGRWLTLDADLLPCFLHARN